jgi:hypothetical protein
MKECARISKLIACVAVLVGIVSMTSAQAAQTGKAVVRSITGEAQYSEGGGWMPLSVGKELMPGTTVRTANDSKLVLFLDQNGPLVMLTENTTLGIDKLNFEPTGVDTIIETQLDVKSGRIVGIAKKLSATSKYEVKTPSGVAGIRGTEYSIAATGEVYVLDGSVVVVSVRPDGSVVTQVVGTGEMFSPSTGRVQPIPAATQDELLGEVRGLVAGAPPIITVDGEPIIFVSPTVGLGSE